MVEVADILYMKKGWEYSRGSRIEYRHGKSLLKDFIYEEDNVSIKLIAKGGETVDNTNHDSTKDKEKQSTDLPQES